MSEPLLEAIAAGLVVYDLGRPLFNGMPQSPNHPSFCHTLPRRHGDQVRKDGSSAANDLIVTGTHVGTHIDALAHVSYQGRLHGGTDAFKAQAGGGFADHGVHTIAPLFCRGLLLDVARTLGVDCCPGGYEITVEDLKATADAEGLCPREGDVVLVRSGWGGRFEEGPQAYLGRDTGVPGVGEEGARWLASTGAVAVGADTIAFERIAPHSGHSLLPAHRVLLVEEGVYIIEALNLEDVARIGLWEFAFLATPLAIVGATGSPLRPLAVASADRATNESSRG